MQLSVEATRLITTINSYSGHKLSREEDLAMLFEVAFRSELMEQFDRLAFLGKFASKTHRIIERIGRNGEGYDKLSKEFGAALEEITTLLHTLILRAPEDEQVRFSTNYLKTSLEGLRNLLLLLSDISWYKSWRTDHPGEEPWSNP